MPPAAASKQTNDNAAMRRGQLCHPKHSHGVPSPAERSAYCLRPGQNVESAGKADFRGRAANKINHSQARK